MQMEDNESEVEATQRQGDVTEPPTVRKRPRGQMISPIPEEVLKDFTYSLLSCSYYRTKM